MNTTSLKAAALLALIGHVSAQSHTVVPPQFATNDAVHQTGVPGVVDQRTQILVGPSHLASMIGQDIQAIELRRSAANEIFIGGKIDLTVYLSIAPHGPLDCSNIFSNNAGPNPTLAFFGQVTVDDSPANVGPTINWSSDNKVRIPVSSIFTYTGGTLCIDIVGHPVNGEELQWWAADATFEHHPGTVTNLTGGCGGVGGTQGDWSAIERHSLVVGGHAHMIAHGTPNGLAIAAIGPQSPPIPLTTLGLTPPGACDLRIFPIDILVPAWFDPGSNPAYALNGGRADLSIKIPNIPGAQGLTLTTQWFDWSQQATSNALEWTIAASIPTLDMASIEGHSSSLTGKASVHIAPVIRLEHQ